MQHSDDEQKARDAYLGKNIRKVAASSSLLQSTSAWLNNGKIREIIAVWLLRKNGPDFPETWVTALQCLEQGIRVGLASPPFWYFRWEDVFEMTPVEARRHFGVPEIDFVDSAAASVIFREDAPRLAEAAE